MVGVVVGGGPNEREACASEPVARAGVGAALGEAGAAARSQLSAQVVREVLLSWFGDYYEVRRIVRACAATCRAWRAALSGFPVDDFLLRDVAWLQRHFGEQQRLWQLRSLRLTGDACGGGAGGARARSDSSCSSSSASSRSSVGSGVGGVGGARRHIVDAVAHRLQPEGELCLLPALPVLGGLVSLVLTDELCRGACLKPLRACSRLRSLQLGCVAARFHSDLSFLEQCGSLEELSVQDAHAVTSLESLGRHCPRLRVLTLRGAARLEEVDGLAPLRQLESVDLAGALSLRHLHGLRHVRRLVKLVLVGCRSLESIAALHDAERLELLVLSQCARLADLAALAGKPRLAQLWVTGCAALDSLEPLRGSAALRVLGIGECPVLYDAGKLSLVFDRGALPALQELYAPGLAQALVPSGCAVRIQTSPSDHIHRCQVLNRMTVGPAH